MDEQTILDLVKGLLPGLKEPLSIRGLVHEEDQAPYSVWALSAGKETWIWKEAKETELDVYAAFFSVPHPSVPKILGTAQHGEKTYFLQEFVGDHNLQKATRRDMRLALDALIALQEQHWGSRSSGGYTFEESVPHREKRGRYLGGDPLLEKAYLVFLQAYQSLPRTLCHDDLLPFNVQLSQNQAWLIDWEYGGILPYPVSLARLLAHGRQEPDALFYLEDADRAFAIDYYYQHLVRSKGVPYPEYLRHLDLFFYYEYCEWVSIGHRHNALDGDYYRHYLPLAQSQARKILSHQE